MYLFYSVLFSRRFIVEGTDWGEMKELKLS